jgi:phosphoribosylanthranilate isomerase
MRRVRVKICGLTREEDVRMVAARGADAVGFVVGIPSSPRSLSLKKVETLLRYVPLFVQSVLVMDPQSIDEVRTTYEALRPDALQLHGDTSLDISLLRENLPKASLIRAVQANPTTVLQDAVDATQAFDAILIDSRAQGRLGGTGVVHDWELSKRVKRVIPPTPLILAGGLNPDNVQDAIRTIEPYAVDVSTGVELSPGVKDPDKVSAFIKKAQEAWIRDD